MRLALQDQRQVDQFLLQGGQPVDICLQATLLNLLQLLGFGSDVLTFGLRLGQVAFAQPRQLEVNRSLEPCLAAPRSDNLV